MRVFSSVLFASLCALGACQSMGSSPFVAPDDALEAKVRQRIDDLQFARGQELVEIIRALVNVGEPAYQLLIDALEHDSAAVRAGSVLILGASGDRRLIPYFDGVAEDPDPTVRYEVARAMVRLGDWSGIPVLVAGMRDPNPVVRGLCHDTLRDATHLDFGFQPAAAADQREQAVARWEEWWERRRKDPFFGRS